MASARTAAALAHIADLESEAPATLRCRGSFAPRIAGGWEGRDAVGYVSAQMRSTTQTEYKSARPEKKTPPKRGCQSGTTSSEGPMEPVPCDGNAGRGGRFLSPTEFVQASRAQERMPVK